MTTKTWAALLIVAAVAYGQSVKLPKEVRGNVACFDRYNKRAAQVFVAPGDSNHKPSCKEEWSMATAHATRRGNGFKDIAGARIGRWTVIEYSHTVGKVAFWLCRCDCGTERPVRSGNLLKNMTRSCGCLVQEMRTHHGETPRGKMSKEYRTWRGVIQRGSSLTGAGAENYARRGIGVCGRWRNSFVFFLNDVGRAPSAKHTIERIDNNKGYEPDNVRWATRAEQNRNTRRNVFISYAGKTMCRKEWSRILGVPENTMKYRIKMLGIDGGMRKCGA